MRKLLALALIALALAGGVALVGPVRERRADIGAVLNAVLRRPRQSNGSIPGRAAIRAQPGSGRQTGGAAKNYRCASLVIGDGEHGGD